MSGYRFWVSWWGSNGCFELHSPWWITGERGYADEGTVQKSFCAAVIAEDEEGARRAVERAHDPGHAPDEWRFVEPRPDNWSPFNDRFQRRDWMRWPDQDEGDADG